MLIFNLRCLWTNLETHSLIFSHPKGAPLCVQNVRVRGVIIFNLIPSFMLFFTFFFPKSSGAFCIFFPLLVIPKKIFLWETNRNCMDLFLPNCFNRCNLAFHSFLQLVDDQLCVWRSAGDERGRGHSLGALRCCWPTTTECKCLRWQCTSLLSTARLRWSKIASLLIWSHLSGPF